MSFPSPLRPPAAAAPAPLPVPFVRQVLQPALLDGTLAGLLSSLVLAWRGRTDIGSAPAPLNAPSHWVYGPRALRRNDASLRYTGVGMAVHYASSLFWAVLYRRLRAGRPQSGTAGAVADAALVTTLAAAVDLKVVPERLTPGFERRLPPRSLWMVYAGFGAGLVLGGLLQHGRREP
jgi:hypothetical protein